MSNSESGNTCRTVCWIMAAVIGLIVLWLLKGALGLFLALLLGIILVVILGIALTRMFCMAELASAATATPAPAPAPEPAPAPKPAEAAKPATAAAKPAVKTAKKATAKKATAAKTATKAATKAAEGQSGSRPMALKNPRKGKADDLKQIKGIGPKLEAECNKMGIYHFDQIAAWTADEVAWMNDNLKGSRGRVGGDNWTEQAGILAAGGETEFSKRVGDGDVY